MNDTLTFFSYFTGGGVAEARLHEIGVQPIGGVEYSADIAAVYRANYGDHIRVASVLDVDADTLPDLDIFWTSPECKEYSTAKSGGKEGPTQIAQAQAICRALIAKQPAYFFLENVRGYLNSAAFRLVRATLDDLGYWSTVDVCNCADYGVAQTRERIIVRAVAGGMFQPYRPLPEKTPWIGWYAAIADLVPTLPESKFADWQLARLPETLKDSFVTDTMNTSREATVRDADPAFTVLAGSFAGSHQPGGRPRAFIVGGQYENPNTSVERHVQNRDELEPLWTVTAGAQRDTRAFLMRDDNAGQEWGKQYRADEEPAYSQSQSSGGRAFIVPGGNASSFDVRYADEPARTVGDVQRVGNAPRAWLSQGRVVAMTPRALARFQSLPDTYLLPEKRTLACTVIGNGAPSEWVKRVIGATIGVL